MANASTSRAGVRAPVAGDRFEMPDGTVFALEDVPSSGEYVQLTISFPPGGFSPSPHLHPRAADDFEVLEGEFELMMEGTWHRLGPGERVVVPPRIPHTIRNNSQKAVVVRNVHRPAMRFASYISEMDGALRAAGITSRRSPRALPVLAATTLRYCDTIVLARPAERLVAQLLAALARAFGWAPGTSS